MPLRPIDLARRLVPGLVDRGARAVTLVGSHARGDGTRCSDLDLAVLGDGPAYHLEVHEGVLVAHSWVTARELRRRFGDPAHVATAVPGWREAVVLHDPEGVAAAIQKEAIGWSWERLGEKCDRWVADSVIGYAEEVQKLVAALAGGQRLTAAAQRDLLAIRLAPVLAVHHRLLYGSENTVWDLVGTKMGADWREAQAKAFASEGETFAQSCTAALRLFRLAVVAVRPLLDDRQVAVAGQALALAGTFEQTRFFSP